MKAFLFNNILFAETMSPIDKAIDDMTHKLFQKVFHDLKESQYDIQRGIALISLIKYIERIGDHCCSIADLTIFMEKREYKNGQCESQTA